MTSHIYDTMCKQYYFIKYGMFKFYVIIHILTTIYHAQMESELTTRKYCPRTTQESEDSMWSEEKEVFYYSNFDLFNCTGSEQEFYQFSIFIDRVASELGKEWDREALHLYHPFLSSNQIFMTLMELWLSQHPPTNTLKTISNITPFNPSFVSLFHQKALQELQKTNPKSKPQPPSTSLKAVCLGFYMTANEAWQQLFQPEPTQKSPPLQHSLFKQVTSTIEQTFKPLMVISEKISSVLGRKKRKFNESVQPEELQSYKFDSCYHQFKKTLDIEKQIQRKMSDLDINIDEECQMRNQNKIIEKKGFQDQESPIKGSLLGNVYQYVTGFLNRNSSWQVASSFVTQILEMNQVRLEEGQKVKVMRPAQDFYMKLVMVWLMFQKRGETNPSFPQYLNCLKTAFFKDNWHQRYLIPTKYFFERMREDWRQITSSSSDQSQKQILTAFIMLIRKGMKKEWDRKMQLNSK